MISFRKTIPLGLALVIFWAAAVEANYTIILKNGRRITVKEYWEDGKQIKVRGMGGEFGIAKDQIDTIINPGRDEEKGMVVPDYNQYQPDHAGQRGVEGLPSETSGGESKAGSGQKNVSTKAKQETEEAAYLRKIKEKTEQLKRLQDRYAVATRGSSGSQSGILDSREAIKGRTADLQSRLKDAQRSRASGGGGAARVDVAPQAYSEKEKKLSELRRQMVQIQNERDALIQEMQQKNLGSKVGSP